MNQQSFQRQLPEVSQILLGILFALSLQGALDAFLSEILPGGKGVPLDVDAFKDGFRGVTLLRYLQLFGVLLLLCRFYFGAFRYISEAQKENGDKLPTDMWDLVGTLVLFIAVYGVCKTVHTTSDLYSALLVMHVIDFFWFLFHSLNRNKLGAVVRRFLAWDVLTLAYFGVVWLVVGTDRTDWALQVSLMAGIVGISALDIFVLQDFYFRPGKWRGDEGATT